MYYYISSSCFLKEKHWAVYLDIIPLKWYNLDIDYVKGASMGKVSVIIPCYNVEPYIGECLDSVIGQTIGKENLEIIVVDDCSTDNTVQILQAYETRYPEQMIVVLCEQNGRQGTARNIGLSYASGEFVSFVDSDDYMPDDAVEKILKFWEENGSDQYAGIVGLDYDFQDNLIGDPLPEQKTVNLIDLLTGKYHLNNGDRTNVVRTSVYREVAPMETFQGEKNFNPHYMHLQISQKYDFLVLNENLKYVEYQPGGMSNSMWKQYLSSPNSFAQTRRLYLSFEHTSFTFRLRHAIHYVSSCLLAGKRNEIMSKSPRPVLCALVFPFGFALSRLTQRKAGE